MVIVVGDVGGTKTHLALMARRGRRWHLGHAQRYVTRQHASLAALVGDFLVRQRSRPSAACFGVAGPVTNGRCSGTNLPWDIDERALRRQLKLNALWLMNDLVATAYSLEALPSRSVAALNAGRPQPRGTMAVIAAGTGLGEAALVWDGRGYRAIPSEGGHADFAPRTPIEIELLKALTRRHRGHVSYERIVSGPGKVAIYEFLNARRRGTEPAWLRERFAFGDRSAIISEAALAGRSALCHRALELFVSIYGAEAGNLALKVLATGGVYLGGGIAPTILPLLRGGAFMKAFCDKGRLAPLMRQIPVRVILEDRVALLGAARYAARQHGAES